MNSLLIIAASIILSFAAIALLVKGVVFIVTFALKLLVRIVTTPFAFIARRIF